MKLISYVVRNNYVSFFYYYYSVIALRDGQGDKKLAYNAAE